MQSDSNGVVTFDRLSGLLLRPLAARPLRGYPSWPTPRRLQPPRHSQLLTQGQRGGLRHRCIRRARRTAQVSLATDMVFSDGAELETPTITGSVAEGYAIVMTAAIAV